MIDFSGIVFNAYKKKSGNISLHARGYLLIPTNIGFSLSAYLRDIGCWIYVPGEKEHECQSISIGHEIECEFDGMTMMHDYHIETVLPFEKINTCVADVKIVYHLAFANSEHEEPKVLNMRVAIIKKYKSTNAKSI
ncbi:hypothetical protein [Arenicella xantha]|uniref:Uncharacterized protein n=1 Tax=Arenicella xantha TaxID=644221 RepID=A0A395JVT2_9GAMM|nr:hypothetical protein [Arenicella xantha]RBP53678.1 hypothetical protein DFR28_1011065 [Arenicella xantha]